MKSSCEGFPSNGGRAIDVLAHTRLRNGYIPSAIAKFDWIVLEEHGKGDAKVTIPGGIIVGRSIPRYVFCRATRESLDILNKTVSRQQDFKGEVLLVGDTDAHLTQLLPHLLPFVRYFNAIRVEAKDCPHDFIETFPQGLSPHYTEAVGESDMISEIHKASLLKEFLVLAAWGAWWPEHNQKIQSRIELYDFVNKSSWIHHRNIDKRFWFQELRRYKFIFNPTGNGIQSSKFAEALLTLTIPIVQNVSAYYDLFNQGFPMVLVDDWSEITTERLSLEWTKLSPSLLTKRKVFSSERWFRYVTQPTLGIQ